MTRKPIVGWLLVVGAALVALLTVIFIGSFASVYGPSTGDWTDGAWFALQNGVIGIALTVVLAALAIVFGRGVFVRVLASIIFVGSLAGLAAAGGTAAQGRYEAAPKAPDCLGTGGSVADPAMQAALDELEHPGWIDTIVVSVDGCASVVRNLTVVEVQDAYRDQLVAAGWVIEEDDETHLIASREGFTLIISECGEAMIAIRNSDAEFQYC